MRKYLFSFVALLGVVTGCSNLAVREEAAIACGRSPAAEGPLCSQAFDLPLRVEALRDRRNQLTQKGVPYPQNHLEQIRVSRLRTLGLEIADILDVLAQAPNRAPVDKLAEIARLVNPSFTRDKVESAIKERSGLGSFVLGAFRKNITEMSSEDVLEIVKEKSTSPAAQVLLVEAFLRVGGQRVSQQSGTELLSVILQTPRGYLLASYVNQDYPANGALTRTALMREYLEFVSSATGLPLNAGGVETSIGTIISSLVSKEKSLVVLKDFLKEQPESQTTFVFISEVVKRKTLTRTQVLEAMRGAELAKRSPSAWKRLLDWSINASNEEKTPDLLSAYDKAVISSLEETGNLADALANLRATKLLRKSLIEKNPDLTGPYIQLLAKMTSNEGRKLVVQDMLELDARAATRYIGDDAYTPSRIDYLLKLGPLSPEAEKSLSIALDTYRQKSLAILPGSVQRGLRHRIEARFPEMKGLVFADAASFLRANELTDISGLRAILRRDQSAVESELQRALDSVIQANAPPELFKSQPQPWTAYLKSLPAQVRAEHLWKILDKNSSNLSNFSNLVAQLEPIEGVRDTVIRYLMQMRAMMSNRTDFSPEQILTMFGGDRFERFFPHLKGVALDGEIRTKIAIAVLTDPTVAGPAQLNLRWLQEKLDAVDVRNGVAQVFGFRPALQYDRLERQLAQNFTGSEFSSPSRQIRGLIVQGHYEKTGHSVMFALNGSRGQAQVETSAPKIRSLIETQLRTGALSTETPLVQRLFALNWSLNSDASLINSIRNRAIRIAELNQNFWNLRVEIHNFPTHDTLRRTKEFQANLPPGSRAFQEIGTIIGELERFLGTNAGGDLKSVIGERLTLSDDNRAVMRASAEGFESLSPLQQLKKLIELRGQFDAIKQRSSSSEARQEFYLGDQALSETATVIFSRWLVSFDRLSIPDRVEGLKLALEHIRRDGFFGQEQVHSFTRSLDAIADSRLSTLQKKELANQVLKGLIDQIYFRMEDEFGFYDNSMGKVSTGPVLKFVDNVMRSGTVFIISKVVDAQAREIALAKNISHSVFGKESTAVVEVYNPGETVGVLRLNKNPMELSKDDIAVFEQMPGESAAVSGFITVGVGARLSHLQLLSKSLKIPNVQISKDILPQLQELDGKWVRFKADEDGRLVLEEASQENRLAAVKKERVQVPPANHDIKDPITFANLVDNPASQFAGPKGVTLAKMFHDTSLREHVPDGFVLPFGFFAEYAERTGLKPLLDLLGDVRLENRQLIGVLTAQIGLKIQKTPLPPDLLAKAKAQVDALGARTGNKLGYFFRSDTNVEDLPNFNGAGLNESVANVRNEEATIDQAIRRVWISPYTEKSIYWRGEALGRKNVTLAEPSVVVMPTVQVQSSGVLLSKGGPEWSDGHGRLSANFGIGSVVEAGRPVEEISFELGQPLLISMSVSRSMPIADESGGLQFRAVQPGAPVLNMDQAADLNRLGQKIEKSLGGQPHGWDIEWGIDLGGRLVILQARPNM